MIDEPCFGLPQGCCFQLYNNNILIYHLSYLRDVLSTIFLVQLCHHKRNMKSYHAILLHTYTLCDQIDLLLLLKSGGSMGRMSPHTFEINGLSPGRQSLDF